VLVIASEAKQSSHSPRPIWIASSPSAPRNDEERFADSAAKFAGLAGALLGWRPDEFWRATPAELAAVLRALAGEEAQAACADDLARLMAMFPD